MKRPPTILWAVLLPLSVLRLALGAQLSLIPDEAYYWSWSLRPDWCYWDQPAGIAWAIRGWTLLFGDSVIALRGLAVACSLGASLFMFAVLRRLLGERPALWSVLILQVTPLFAAGATLIMHDSLLMLFAAAAWWAFTVTVQENRQRWWLWTGVLLAAALYAKFSAVLLGAGFAVAVLLHPTARRHLRTPWPYLGATLAGVLFAPVVLWNIKHQWVAYHAVSKLAGDPTLTGGARLLSLLDFLGGQLLVASPMLALLAVPAVWRTIREWRSPTGQNRLLLAAPALVILVYFFVNSLRAKIQANWPAMAWVALLPLAVDWAAGQRFRRRLLMGGTALALLMSALIHIQVFQRILPLDPDITDQFYGWPQVARQIDDLRRAHGQPALMTRRYQIAAELLYILPDRPDVYTADFAHRGSQFTIWQDYGKLVGHDVLFVDSQRFPGKLKRHFALVEQLPSLARLRDGQPVETLYVYLARNFTWAGPGEAYVTDPVAFQIERMIRKRAAGRH